MTEQQSDDFYIPTFLLKLPAKAGTNGAARKILKTSSRMPKAGLNVFLLMNTTSGTERMSGPIERSVYCCWRLRRSG